MKKQNGNIRNMHEETIEMRDISDMWMEIWIVQNNYLIESKKSSRIKISLNKLRKKPLFIWFISLIQILVFLVELIQSWLLTGSPIQLKPSFNPVIGPNVYLLIRMGARFSPCMHTISGITDNNFYYFLCLNNTNLIEQKSCSLNDICGFNLSSPPNQWYRFIIPIFLHSGLIHIGFNLLTQLILGAFMENKNGSLRLLIIYFASGIFGIIIDGNFAPNGFVTVGCSGSLFGIIALYLVNIIYDWRNGISYEFITLIIDIIINFCLGLLPSIGNFNHIAGFIMGFILSVTLLVQPRRFHFIKSWIWLILRFTFLIFAILLFIFSIENIYSRKIQCTWCKYLDCLPINNWCHIGYLKTNITINSTLNTFY
ncbi:unnamed protein product [Adineta steineri]|uniref:rhomboid protease n=1 Tax=Adineta steineri TaxID=433720 RepID=A0A814HNQ4_9BILA|nr:unnamed protein product [Adineta steineri]